MKINNLYDAVYYINLDSRTDRLRKFWDYNQKFLDQEKTIRITACDAKNTCAPKVRNGKLAPGDMQSLMMARTAHAVSYSKAFIDALANGYKKIFIFEDDAEPLFEDIETFFFYESEAEKMGYDMFYAGGQIVQDIEPAGNYLYKINNNVLATQAISYRYNETVFEKLAGLNDFNKTYESFTNHTKWGDYSTDEMIAEELTPITKSFISNRILFGQYADHSDIECRKTNHSKLMQEKLKQASNLK